MDLTDLAAALAAKDRSPRELLDGCLARIEQRSDLNSFITVCAETAQTEADQAQADGALAGMPLAAKDIFMTKDVKTTCASQMLAEYVAPYESHATAALREAGMLLAGKCNMDEFAMGTTGENSSFGACRNPWDAERSAGGSSSGSAAAVAARLVPVALGTDTGGSVRMPAAYCGISGIKPTYGLVSRRGMVAYASSLDQAGVLAASARDLRMVLKAIANHDPQDSTSLPQAACDDTPLKREGLKGMKIAVVPELFGAGVDDGVAASVKQAIAELEQLGLQTVEAKMPSLQHAIAAYYIIACAEASSNLARYDGLLYGTRAEGDDLEATVRRSRSAGFGPEVQRRIMLGTFVLSHGYVDAYYRQALKVRQQIKKDFARAFDSADLIAAPAAPTVAPKLGAFADDPVLMYSQDLCTIPANLAGLPAIALPCAPVDGLPAGLQLIGPALAENKLLSVGEHYQQETGHHQLLPPNCEDWT